MRFPLTIALLVTLPLFACSGEKPPAAPPPTAKANPIQDNSNIPPLDETNIVSLAMKSKDHTTLVAAIQAAHYVTSVAASGPFTVFAPTNAAFDKLPTGTVDSLVKPENIDKLRQILQYHVTTSAYPLAWLTDGQKLGMANGAKATIGVKD